MANINLIITEILKLQSSEEVNDAITEINSAIKIVRNRETKSIKASLSVGDTVSMPTRHGAPMIGTLIKIKRTQAHVDVDGTTWNTAIKNLSIV